MWRTRTSCDTALAKGHVSIPTIIIIKYISSVASIILLILCNDPSADFEKKIVTLILIQRNPY